MNALITGLPPNFLAAFLAGMLVNFEIAAIALGLGLAVGLLLAAACGRQDIAGRTARSAVGLMRAAPTFVVMFFLLNALPRDGALSGVMVVALSLAPYAAAYISDSAIDALRQWRMGSPLAGCLILPNIARAYFVMVMSSSAGAAIGVHEGIAVILRQAETLHALSDMLALFAFGVVCFGVPLQAGFAMVRALQQHLGRFVLNRSERSHSKAAGSVSSTSLMSKTGDPSSVA
jgi:hypothetical protein